jgi:glutamate/tyrosine decarboxylase-like PLP-dependent enzyme
VSDQAHSSVKNTLSILDVDPFVVRTADHRFTGDALRAALDADTDPDTIVAVVATSGTTNAGIIDDLRGIGTLAHERGMWFHVDGAYGGAGLFAPSVRHRYDGIELADSFIVDPHKWLFAPFDCAALLYREPWLAKRVHTQDASYLDAIHHDDGSYEWNPTDYAYHLTRRARGLPLWFSLVVNGTDAYTEAIEHSIALTRAVADEIEATEHLELVREPSLGVVLFRRRGWTAHDYDAWGTRLLTAQVAFVTSTTWEGETIGRFSFLHPATTLEMVREVLATTA